MLVVSRFRYDEDRAAQAATELGSCVEGFAGRPGFVSGCVGRALDDPAIWVLSTTWADVGSYRRALSSFEIKMQVVPLLSYAIDEPSAYEIIVGDGATEPNRVEYRGE